MRTPSPAPLIIAVNPRQKHARGSGRPPGLHQAEIFASRNERLPLCRPAVEGEPPRGWSKTQCGIRMISAPVPLRADPDT